MLKKLEACPICGAVLMRADYDMQTHANHWVSLPPIFFHATPKPEACDHDFQGWREFADGNGGERVCAKCGLGAMAHSLRVGP